MWFNFCLIDYHWYWWQKGRKESQQRDHFLRWIRFQDSRGNCCPPASTSWCQSQLWGLRLVARLEAVDKWAQGPEWQPVCASLQSLRDPEHWCSCQGKWTERIHRGWRLKRAHCHCQYKWWLQLLSCRHQCLWPGTACSQLCLFRGWGIQIRSGNCFQTCPQMFSLQQCTA